LNQKSETKEVETLTEKVTIEIHRIGASVAPYLPKELLRAIPCTAQKLRELKDKPWLVVFSIRTENGKPVLAMEMATEKEVNGTQ
jgi:ureidoglycolate hydrolase